VDLLFNVETKATRNQSITMRPGRKVEDPATLDGSKVHNGVSWFNTVHAYWSEGFSERQSEQDAQGLASTLVHEVNHILNESEENYRGDRSILCEEYRAFYAEAAFRGEDASDPDVCRRIKQGVIEDYGLEGVTPDDVPGIPPGTLIP
jgi:hypothetical protein